MLSKKMAVSLTSLITIFALAFVVTPAIALFDTTLEADPIKDVSHADNFQAEYGATITVRVIFGKVVALDTSVPTEATTEPNEDDFELADIAYRAYNKFGGIVHTQAAITAANFEDAELIEDGKNFTVNLPTIAAPGTGDDAATVITRVLLHIGEGEVVAADPTDDEKNKASNKLEIQYVNAEFTTALTASNSTLTAETLRFGSSTTHTGGTPVVYSMMRPGNPLIPSVAYSKDTTFDVVVTLSEEAKKDTFTKDRFSISEAEITAVTALAPIDEVVPDANNRSATDMPSTGRDGKLHRYLLTVTPKYANTNDIVIKINAFYDQETHTPKMFQPPLPDVARVEGVTKLTVKVREAKPAADRPAGLRLDLPHGESAKIPGSGFYILVKDKAYSGIEWSEEKDASDKTQVENIASKQTPAQLLYNVRASTGLPNLERFLLNNGTIDLVSYADGAAAGDAYISEVMWGTDATSPDATGSQWIEIANGGTTAIDIGDKTWALWFYQVNEALPASYTDGVLLDRIGTRTPATATASEIYWSVAGKGQSGRTNVAQSFEDVAIVPTVKLKSMYRVMDAAGKPASGTVSTSWMQSTPPSVNFRLGIEGEYDASPGAKTVDTPAEAADKKKKEEEEAKKAADTSVPMPQVGQIYISEIMFAGGGTLPQWIEISNGSRTEQVNLSGWTLTVDNAPGDTDVSVGASIKFTIPEGTKIDPSAQNDTPSTLLVVTEAGRNNLTGTKSAGQVLNLWESAQTELILADVTKRRYSLISGEAFEITLAPPAPAKTNVAALAATATAAQKAAAKAADAKDMLARTAATDIVGNLAADGAAAWVLPMNMEGGRSSIIREHISVTVGPAEPQDGTDMKNWRLASETSFVQATHIRASSYYGAANDVGTPGFRAGGALPVELSHFRPARDKATGAVVITWATQSELNNAGFFIKRSNQRNGEFKVINATMIPGAGTTSEKQFYTYTDTTAQPNVVYYYQIEDVSLDGNRQTLTRGIRLKGHIGAAGKATTLWGELKASNE